MPRTASNTRDTDYQALHKQVSELGDQLNGLVKRIKQEGGNAAEEELGILQDKLNVLLSDAKEKGQEAWNKVEDTVRERPGTSLVTAFAAGAILAGLLLRR